MEQDFPRAHSKEPPFLLKIFNPGGAAPRGLTAKLTWAFALAGVVALAAHPAALSAQRTSRVRYVEIAPADAQNSSIQIKTLQADPKLHAMLPEKNRTSGVLNLATDAHYPPCESFAEDNKTMVGWEPDFWNALGQVMGVKVQAESTAFAGLIPGVASGSADSTISMRTWCPAGTSWTCQAANLLPCRRCGSTALSSVLPITDTTA